MVYLFLAAVGVRERRRVRGERGGTKNNNSYISGSSNFRGSLVQFSVMEGRRGTRILPLTHYTLAEVVVVLVVALHSPPHGLPAHAFSAGKMRGACDALCTISSTSKTMRERGKFRECIFN